MPVIARFYGLVIKMYFQQKEHNPPYFHVMYGEYMGAFEIPTLRMMEGDLPAKAQALGKRMGCTAYQGAAGNLEYTRI